jgi:hypothetical protein
VRVVVVVVFASSLLVVVLKSVLVLVLRWAVSSEVAARVMDGMARARARERSFVIWLGGMLVLFCSGLSVCLSVWVGRV